MRRDEKRRDERRSGIVCVGLKCEGGKREKRGVERERKRESEGCFGGGVRL